MSFRRTCRNCSGELPTLSRSDAVYCSSKCRLNAYRNPFPKELVVLDRWIRFSKSKVPLTPKNEVASSIVSRTWSSYKWVASSHAGIGMGFVFNGDGIIGIDLDNAIDENGIKDWAKLIVDSFPATYTEISPSGKGIHLIGRGEIFQGRRWKFHDGGIEIYGNARYFTMTGKRFEKTPKRISRLGNVLDIISPILEG